MQASLNKPYSLTTSFPTLWHSHVYLCKCYIYQGISSRRGPQCSLQQRIAASPWGHQTPPSQEGHQGHHMRPDEPENMSEAQVVKTETYMWLCNMNARKLGQQKLTLNLARISDWSTMRWYNYFKCSNWSIGPKPLPVLPLIRIAVPGVLVATGSS